MRLFAALCMTVLVAGPNTAHAAFTNTNPRGVFVLEERLLYSKLERGWNGEGERSLLAPEMNRYEPGGGLQGTIVPDLTVYHTVLINMLGYGITDSLTALLAVPVVLRNRVVTKLGWRSGDYSPLLGRSYSEDDFWQWAGSMGQPKPGSWSGNAYTLSDIILGGRWRFSDLLDESKRWSVDSTLTVMGALPTGKPPDPEEVVTSGTTSWDLHSQGDLGIHLSFDKTFRGRLDGRLTLGVDLFHEFYFPQERESGTGKKNPLILNNRPYVGKTYVINPGDFTGFALATDVVVWRGPTWRTWLSDRVTVSPEGLPPLVALSLQYCFTFVGQSDWKSESALWDWEQEKLWAPGYKNILMVSTTVSLLRVGVPAQLTLTLRNLTLLPGKNVRAPNIVIAGLQVPFRFF